MQNVVLIAHLIIALCLIVAVLLQRSEGGALGMGGGGGGMMSARGAATALGKLTWVLAIAFLCTSITLTILAGGRNDTGSVFDGQPINPDAAIPLPDIDDGTGNGAAGGAGDVPAGQTAPQSPQTVAPDNDIPLPDAATPSSQ